MHIANKNYNIISKKDIARIQNFIIERAIFVSGQDADTVILKLSLNELEKIPQALETNLKSFVEKGGNLVVIPSNENATSDLNRFLGMFGKIQFGALQNVNKLVTKIAFQHPLFQSVFEKKNVNFQYPNTKQSFGVASPNPPVLSFEDQSVFLTALQNQISAVYVFSAPINKVNSNYLDFIKVSIESSIASAHDV